MKKYLFLALFVCLLPDVAAAGMREYFQQVQRDVKETWKSDEYDLFVPVYAWHNRLTYDQKHIDKYKKTPGVWASVKPGTTKTATGTAFMLWLLRILTNISKRFSVMPG